MRILGRKLVVIKGHWVWMVNNCEANNWFNFEYSSNQFIYCFVININGYNNKGSVYMFDWSNWFQKHSQKIFTVMDCLELFMKVLYQCWRHVWTKCRWQVATCRVKSLSLHNDDKFKITFWAIYIHLIIIRQNMHSSFFQLDLFGGGFINFCVLNSIDSFESPRFQNFQCQTMINCFVWTSLNTCRFCGSQFWAHIRRFVIYWTLLFIKNITIWLGMGTFGIEFVFTIGRERKSYIEVDYRTWESSKLGIRRTVRKSKKRVKLMVI